MLLTFSLLFQLYPECRFKLTEAEFSIGSEQFHWSGSTPVSPGYTCVYTWHEVQGIECPVQFERGQVWDVAQVTALLYDPPVSIDAEAVTLRDYVVRYRFLV